MPRRWRAAFILALVKYGEPAKASRAVGVDPSTPYRHRATNRAFKKQWNEAIDQHARSLAKAIETAPQHEAEHYI